MGPGFSEHEIADAVEQRGECLYRRAPARRTLPGHYRRIGMAKFKDAAYEQAAA